MPNGDSTLAQLVGRLESGSGAAISRQPAGMADPYYGQMPGFVRQYGSGAAGVENYARQVLASNPSATFGDFYSGYVLGTGDPAAGYSPAKLRSSYPAAYQNLIKNAGHAIDAPLASLVSGAAGGGEKMGAGLPDLTNYLGAGPGGPVTNVLGMFGLNPNPTSAQQQAGAAAFPGTTPNQFVGFGPNAPPVDPAAVGAGGAAPSGGGGFFQGLTDFLTNPLVQGAANAYFTAISAPRNTSIAGRLGLGGLAGMQTVAQQERLAELDPLERQITEQQLAESRVKTKVAERGLIPIPSEVTDQLDQYRQTLQQELTNPAQPLSQGDKAIAQWNLMNVSTLEALTHSGAMSPADFQTALGSFNASKQQLDAARAEEATQKAFMEEQLMPLYQALVSRFGATLPGGLTAGPGAVASAAPGAATVPAAGADFATGVPAAGGLPATPYPSGFKPVGGGSPNIQTTPDGRYAIYSGGAWQVPDGKGGWTSYTPGTATAAGGRAGAPAAGGGVDLTGVGFKPADVKQGPDGTVYAQDPTSKRWKTRAAGASSWRWMT